MDRREKLLAQIRNNPNNVRFEDLDKLLQAYGFVLRRPKGGGSHYVYKRTGCAPMTVPRHKPVGRVYVMQVLAKIDECGEPDEA